jgi:hypothetical protein
MRVEEVEGKTCDLKLEDISEEEYSAMFLEGIRELVREARKGKVSDYIVLPYDDVPKEIKDKAKGATLEVSDEDSDALVQIGAVSMIKKGLKAAEEEGNYWKNLKEACEDAGELWEVTNDDGSKRMVQHKMKKYEPEFGKLGEVWDDERMDIIGQNGNDGLHYERDIDDEQEWM